MNNLTKEEELILELSEAIVKAQQPIRILNALKWKHEIKKSFLKNPNKLPKVSVDTYKDIKLGFNPEDKLEELEAIGKTIQKRLGMLSPLAGLMHRICDEYKVAVRLIQARGTKQFSHYSHQLYGEVDDAFYLNGPTLLELSELLNETIPRLTEKTLTQADEKKYDSAQAVEILNCRIKEYFHSADNAVSVVLADDIVSDAAAGSEVIKVNKDSMFSDRDLKLLEVHEGWVHLGTTLNGRQQKICTFLSRGTPSATITQEGLAILMEIFTHSSYPARIKRLNDRIIAISMVENGADFLDIIKYFTNQGHSLETAYTLASRVFRGGLANGKAGAFTKDLSYTKGFILIYNYMRIAIKLGKLDYIPFLFVGKSALPDIKVLYNLYESGYVDYPKYVPPQIQDIAAVSSWLSFSLFMSRFDISKLEKDFQNIL